MPVLRIGLRIYSYIFEAALSLVAIVVAMITLLSPNEDLRLGWLPWTGAKLNYWLLGLGIAGLICVLLAVLGKFRILLFVFSASMVVLMVRGFLLSPYMFQNAAEFKRAMLLTAGALLATVGSWPAKRKSPGRNAGAENEAKGSS